MGDKKLEFGCLGSRKVEEVTRWPKTQGVVAPVTMEIISRYVPSVYQCPMSILCPVL
jgi:hypothetical protein